jgi:hypothetical protein
MRNRYPEIGEFKALVKGAWISIGWWLIKNQGIEIDVQYAFSLKGCNDCNG